ncbi:MAG: hypothetical protein ABMA26_19085 [Limisphaerales bacterium]
MKLLPLAVALLAAAALTACKKDEHAGHDHKPGEGHGHKAEAKPGAKVEHKHVKAPNGGKIFEIEPDHIEFVVEKDRTATVRFYDKDMNLMPAGARTVTAIGDAPSGKVTLAFTANGSALATTAPFPEGTAYPVALAYKASADAKPVNFRLKLNLNPCGECKLLEYACTCDH